MSEHGGWLGRVRQWLRPVAPPAPWSHDLIGEAELQRIEARRDAVSQEVQVTREALDASLADEIEAIRREHGRHG